MNFFSLVSKSRSCRRFHQEPGVDSEFLKYLVDLARITPSAANLQPLKYILSCHSDTNALIYECLGWAGYLKNWQGPIPEERPTGYIIILGDQKIAKNFDMDVGIVAQTMLLGAYNKGFGGCMLANIRHKQLTKALNIELHYKILLVLALGTPKEPIVLESVKPDGDIRYFRDDQERHHVPKRDRDDLIAQMF